MVKDDSQCLGWCHGTVEKVMNVKTNRIRLTNHKLVPGNWNPKVPKKGGCRQYLTE